MAACLFSRKRRSKGHEQELREELLQSPGIGIEKYPSRKAFATHLLDSHSSTFSQPMASLESMLRFLMPVLRKKAETKRIKKHDEVSVELSNTEDNPRENNCRKLLLSAQLQVQQPSLLHDTVHAVISVIHEKV